MSGPKILLRMSNISKRFPGTLALDRVGLEVREGEVLVLLGENGAGKSTLVKIIAGVYARDGGEMVFDGKPVNFEGVQQAREAGIGIIHQELNLLPERTIAQNIYVGREPTLSWLPGVVDLKKMVADSRKLLGNLGVDLDPNTPVKNLSIAQQQMVEVVKALSNRTKLLIMDEPTSSLTKREIDKLFEIIGRLKKANTSIIYISHRMDEIKIVGDRAVIMRDGEYIDAMDVKTMSMDEAVAKMVGRKITHLYQRRYNDPGEEVFSSRDLAGLRFRGVNINVRAGEIVSLAGLVGAGRTELAKAVFGYDPILRGSFKLFGRTVKAPTPKKCVRLGMAFLPEDRKGEGVILKMPIKENLVAACLGKIFPGGIINRAAEAGLAEEYRRELKIATPDVDKTVGELSGGNQQKVVVGKWLATDGKFFIFDEPTRGIDVGAKAEIYQLLDNLASRGAAILMISSEMNEVVGLSDRVYVMREGEVVKEFQRHELSQEAIISHAIAGGEAQDA
ncbi:MAG: sugar ABC transporter ATP-binding protein [Planctomycetota bacterium]|jgi:ribose transport system ATP-binding protein|nr:sugar ABC transporter ATP-binding protein [Planctomycetota bacterium]